MKGPWVAIQRNPTSGSGTRRGVLLELIRELKRHGIRPRLFASRERMQDDWLGAQRATWQRATKQNKNVEECFHCFSLPQHAALTANAGPAVPSSR